MANEKNFEPNNKTASLELIVYQIGQLDKGVAQLTAQLISANEKMDNRVRDLELWKASVVEKESNPRIDVQKIILAAFGIVSAALAIIASNQAGWIK